MKIIKISKTKISGSGWVAVVLVVFQVNDVMVRAC